MNNVYTEYRQRKSKEFNNFDMAFAFNEKQLKEGLERLNIRQDEAVSIGSGGFIRKLDVDKFNELIEKFKREEKEMMKDDEYIYHMFLYELGNHEYIITYDIGDTLDACDITFEEFESDERLQRLLKEAKKTYLETVR